MQVVEGTVAAVQQIVCDLRDAFDCAGNVDAYRVLLIQAAEHVEKDAPAGIVIAHPDFLSDNALLFGNAFRGEIRRLYKGQ